MPTNIPRLTVTPLTQLSYERIHDLAEIKGCSISVVIAHALEQWLRDNYINEIRSAHQHYGVKKQRKEHEQLKKNRH